MGSVFFFVPLAIKSGENLVQIASVSAYIKIFFEYTVSKDTINFNWEISNNIFGQQNVKRSKYGSLMKWYNEEYTILAIFSSIFLEYMHWLVFIKS